MGELSYPRSVLVSEDVALLRTLSDTNGYTLGQRCKDAGLPSDRRGLANAHARMCHMEREGLVRPMDDHKPIIWLLTAKGEAEIAARNSEAP